MFRLNIKLFKYFFRNICVIAINNVPTININISIDYFIVSTVSSAKKDLKTKRGIYSFSEEQDKNLFFFKYTDTLEVVSFLVILNVKERYITIENKSYKYICVYYVSCESVVKFTQHMYDLDVYVDIYYLELLESLPTWMDISSSLIDDSTIVSLSEEFVFKNKLQSVFHMLYSNNLID